MLARSLLLIVVATLGLRAFALESPARLDSGEANLFTVPNGTTYLTWCAPSETQRAGERVLRFATLAPGATTWSEPRTIVSTPALMENWADFPSLIVGTDGQLWAQWFQKKTDADSHGYSGWFARSPDGGVTWSTPAPLGHEFVSLAPLSGGRMLAAWLESTRETAAHSHAHDHAATSSEPAMKLNSCLLAPDGTTLREWTVDPDVCTCCQTTLTTLDGDRVFVAYRGHTPGEIRDNHHAIFDGTTWGAPQALFNDRWQIAGCPVNGPASAARGKALAVAWFTAAEGHARVRAKFSTDGGATFGAMHRIDLGQPMGRIDVAMLADGSAVITWMETKSAANAAGIYARRLHADGTLSPAALIAESSQARTSGFPRIAVRSTDTLLLTWTEDAKPTQVRTVEFKAP
ncbi:hypothetical protein [Oleiharenicola lentus]|uniref:hypothetical protein n=1 Tax=Oleiharenicola lentus TaxID=2508720 RepID=UPI003F681747